MLHNRVDTLYLYLTISLGPESLRALFSEEVDLVWRRPLQFLDFFKSRTSKANWKIRNLIKVSRTLERRGEGVEEQEKIGEEENRSAIFFQEDFMKSSLMIFVLFYLRRYDERSRDFHSSCRVCCYCCEISLTFPFKNSWDLKHLMKHPVCWITQFVSWKG